MAPGVPPLKALRWLVLAPSFLLIVGACSSPVPPAFEDVLVSCPLVAGFFVEERQSFGETGASRLCTGGDWIESAQTGGLPVRRFHLAMSVGRNATAVEAQWEVDWLREQVARSGDESGESTVSVPSPPWTPAAPPDDYSEAEHRHWLDALTARPSVSYQVAARVGRTRFSIWTADYGAYATPGPWPVGNTMRGNVTRVMELLVERYRALGFEG